MTNHTDNITVVVNYLGNDNYTGFTNTTIFNVSRSVSNSSIVVPGNVNLGETIVIGVIVFDENNGGLGDIPLNITVGGKFYHVTTDINGKWNLSYAADRAGNSTVTVNWTGNVTYYGFLNSTRFSVFEVKKEDISLFKKGVVSKRVKISKFYIKVLKYMNWGNAVGSKVFSFKFSKKYSLSYLKGSGPVKLKFNKKTNTVTVYVTNLLLMLS